MALLDQPEALVALGVLQGERGRSLSSEDVESAVRGGALKDILRPKVVRGAVAAYLEPSAIERLQLPSMTRQRLVETWCEALEAAPRGDSAQLRLQLEGGPPSALSALRARVDGAAGVGAATLIDRTLESGGAWHWPLRVGFLDDRRSRALEDATSGRSPYLALTSRLRHTGESCDLLLLPTAADLEQARRLGLRTSLAVVLEDLPDEDLDALLGLARSVGSSGAAVISRPRPLDVFYQELLEGLSRDLPPDLAVARSSLGRPFTLVAHPDFLAKARVSRILAGLRTGLEEKLASKQIDLESFNVAMDELGGSSVIRARRRGYDAGTALELPARASRGGYGPAPVSHDAPAPSAERTKELGESRWLQSQVFERTGGGLVQRTLSFARGGIHKVKARIGRSSLDWLQTEREFPDEALPAGDAPHQLTVIFRAPGLLEGPQRRFIVLPAGAESSVAEVDIRVPEDAERVEISILVIYGNTPLQAARLAGPVSGSAPRDGLEERLEMTLSESVALDLSIHRPRELLLHKDGDSLLLTCGSSEPVELRLRDLEDRVEDLSKVLFDAARSIDQLGGGLGEGRGLNMLRILASHGDYLRRKLAEAVEDPASGSMLDAAVTVQCTSSSASDFFPAEFLYDFPPPDLDAVLCPDFADASPQDGPCRRCADGDGSTVCPSGFWGLRRIIDRRILPWRRRQSAAPEPSRRRPSLEPATSVVFAASDEVDADAPNTIAKTLTRLQEVTDRRAFHAKTWRDWSELVRGRHPALLVALPHNVVNSLRFQALQISADEELPLNRIHEAHVRPKGAEPGPVLLLLGCNTALGDIAYEDFVTELRHAGAAVVVGTLATVIGRQAAPVAVQLVERLWASQGEAELSFGEAFRRARWEILQQGSPLALTLAAYGNCDWRASEA